ncbi:tetratricopeptide repeat protein [Phascolarctobacterium sp.]
MKRDIFLIVAVLLLNNYCYANISNGQNEAVILARRGNYQEALCILDNISDSDPNYWDDYLTILCWDRQYDSAEAVFQKRFKSDLHKLQPYTLRALANLRMEHKNVDGVIAAGYVLLEQKDFSLTLKIAESLMHMGEIGAANTLYTALLVSNNTDKTDIFLSKAILAIEHLDMIEANNQYNIAINSLAKSNVQKKMDIDALISAKYIQKGEYGTAINILQPYIDSNFATVKMKADYLTALRYTGQKLLAESYFTKFFPDSSDAPLFGLQNMADMYFREHEYLKAEKIYKEMLNRDLEQPYAQIGLAYCLAIEGKEEEALAEYEQIAREYPSFHKILASDARSFITLGKSNLGRKIFENLGLGKTEQLTYKYRYANSMAENGFYHESNDVYTELMSETDFESKGLLGRIKNNVREGLYGDADRLLKRLNEHDCAGKNYIEAQIYREQESRKGEAFTYYSHSDDYKGNNNIEYGISSEHHLDGNFYWGNELNFSFYRKNADKVNLKHFRIGPLYKFDRGQVGVRLVHALDDYTTESMELHGVYEFSDYNSLNFITGERPHGEAPAIKRDIDEKYLISRFEQRINDKTIIGLDLEYANISDGNKFNSIAGDITHNILNKKYHANNLILNYGYSTYDFESPYYESPQLRINYGVGISKKLIARDEKRSLEIINMLAWGHDNNEPTDFNPYTRLEYTKWFNFKQRLVVGSEYGWRSNKLDNRNSLSKSHYHCYVNYYWEW